MTIDEALGVFGYVTTQTNAGETLTSVCRRIYGGDDEVFRKILTYLNCRFDWDNLAPAEELRYISPENTSSISEIW